MDRPSVIILGAGISGLTVAHTLIDRGFDVTVFERNKVCGGLARSEEKPTNATVGICPSEISWRVEGSYYFNLISLLKTIPYNSGNDFQPVENRFPKGNVFQNLNPVLKGSPTGCENITPLGIDFSVIPHKDRITLLTILLRAFISCDERNIEELSDLNWSEYLKEHDISEETYKMVVRTLGPVLGFENNKASIYDVSVAAEILFNTNLNPFMKFGDAYFFNGPSNTKWFDPWVTYLTQKGVKIHTSATVEHIHFRDGLVRSVDVFQKGNYKADYFIGALSLESIIKLAKSSESLSSHLKVHNLEKLYFHGRQVQLSMQFYFNKRAFFQNKYSVTYLPNAPWAIIIQPSVTVWRGTFDIGKYCSKEIQDIWSVGICETHMPGLLIKKSFVECTPDEIASEVWYQVQNEPNFAINVCVSDKSKFSDLRPMDYKIWHTFQYKNGKMDTCEPKFANNTFTKKLRPNTKTSIKNFFLAGAICNTSVNIYTMEGACEAGLLAANDVINSCKIGKPVYIHQTERALPILLAIPRLLDSILYKLGLSTFHALIISLFVTVIYFYYRSVKRR